jgi:hypothetical protein
VAALISKATGIRPSFVGKPNPLMMARPCGPSTPTRSRRGRFPFLPSRIVGSVADLVDEIPDQGRGSSQNGLV